jgi:hypothetical protein
VDFAALVAGSLVAGIFMSRHFGRVRNKIAT